MDVPDDMDVYRFTVYLHKPTTKLTKKPDPKVLTEVVKQFKQGLQKTLDSRLVIAAWGEQRIRSQRTSAEATKTG